MSERARAAARIARVRAQMADLADLRRIEAERAFATATEIRDALDRFSATMQPTGPLARTVLAQSARLAQRHAQAGARCSAAITAGQTAQRELKIAENLAERLRRDAQAVAERRDLERLIEALAGQPAATDDPASLP